jgi:thymidylate kinase
MKILILEGIATSGKSTITDRIREQLVGMSVRVVTEEETHIPIMKQTSELHITFFEELIKRLVTDKPNLIIFDRLYLTQAFRAGVSLEEYSDLENVLSKYDTLTVFLKVDDHAVAERVTSAVEHRNPAWGEYVKTKGKTTSEIADYYISQQRNQIDLLNASKLAHMVCDTTNHDYKEITKQILEKLQLK